MSQRSEFADLKGLISPAPSTDDDTLLAVLAAHSYDIHTTASYLIRHGLATPNHSSSSTPPSHPTNSASSQGTSLFYDDSSSSSHQPLLHNPYVTRRAATSSVVGRGGGSGSGNNRTGTVHSTATGDTDWSWWSYLNVPLDWGRWLLSFVLPASWIGYTSSSSAAHMNEQQFIQRLHEQYPNLPVLYSGTYPGAVRQARTQNRHLLVYLHTNTQNSAETSRLLSETLSDESVRNYINENLIMWCGSIQHRDGYRLCHTLAATSFPFIALLATNTNPSASQASSSSSSASRASTNQVALIYRHSGMIDSNHLIGDLLESSENYSHQLSTQRVARESSRSLIAEQDEEYKQALEADRRELHERKQQYHKQQEELARQRQEEERIQRQEDERKRAEERRQQERQHRRQLSRQQLPAEPPVGGADTVSVGIKLPNAANKRIGRRFRLDDRVGSVYDYIDSLEDIPINNQYNILTNFPRRVHNDKDIRIRELNLGKQILFIVEPIEEDDADGINQDGQTE